MVRYLDKCRKRWKTNQIKPGWQKQKEKEQKKEKMQREKKKEFKISISLVIH